MPDRRDHHGQEEHDPEERAARQVLRAQESEPEADAILREHADADVEQGHDQAAGAAIAAVGQHDQKDEKKGPGARHAAPEQAWEGGACGPGIADERRDQPDRDHPEHGPARRRQLTESTEEMKLLAAEQQLLVVQQADELELEAAFDELEARQRQVKRDQQRKNRHREHDQHGRHDEHCRGMPIEPAGEPVPRAGARLGGRARQPGKGRLVVARRHRSIELHSARMPSVAL